MRYMTIRTARPNRARIVVDYRRRRFLVKVNFAPAFICQSWGDVVDFICGDYATPAELNDAQPLAAVRFWAIAVLAWCYWPIARRETF